MTPQDDTVYRIITNTGKALADQYDCSICLGLYRVSGDRHYTEWYKKDNDGKPEKAVYVHVTDIGVEFYDSETSELLHAEII